MINEVHRVVPVTHRFEPVPAETNSSRDVILFGSDRLFGQALGALLRLRANYLTECPDDVASLVEVIQRRHVDACILDVSTEADAGILDVLRHGAPDLPVVVIGSEDDPSLLASTLRLDADGMCLRSDGIDEIERVLGSVRRTQGNDRCHSRGIVAAQRRSSESHRFRLTEKEGGVLELLVLGTSTSGIANELRIAEATVRTHLQHLFAKFGVHNRIALIAAALQVDGVSSQLAGLR